jgi:hypothetical protein
MMPLWRVPGLRANAGVGFVEHEYLLAEASQGDTRKVARLPPPTQWRKSGRNDAQRATATKRAGRHSVIDLAQPEERFPHVFVRFG